MKEKKYIYKVIFHNRGQVYIVYAKNIYQSELYGFIEIENYLFGEQTQMVIDPGEEKLKKEFDSVYRSYVPLHAIIRIDEVEKEGQSKVLEGGSENMMPFPMPAIPQGDKRP